MKHLLTHTAISLLAGLSLTLPFNTQAAASVTDQRQLYQQAIEDLKAGKDQAFSEKKAALTDYPLYPYLEQRALEHNLADTHQTQIDHYLERFRALPPAQLLQQRWLRHLAAKQHWKDYLIAYQAYPVNRELYACHHRTALLKTGKTAAALKGIESVWNQGHSLTEACDPVFDYWINKQGGPDTDLAYQRFWKAVDNNSISLARYLQRFIKDPSQKNSTGYFFKVRSNPALIKNTDLLSQDNVASRETLLYGIERLSRKSPQSATGVWLRVRPELTLGSARVTELNRTLARRLAARPDKTTDQLLGQLSIPIDSEIQNRRIILALSSNRWEQVYNLIDQLKPADQAEEKWIYWKTIAASHIKGLKPEYSDAFLQLSKARSYYGLLAGQLLKTKFHLNPQQDRVSDALLETMQATPAVKRMHELYQINERYLARREWNRFTATMDKQQLRAAATLVHRWGWHSQAIRGIAQARYWDDITLRFPMPYEDLFQQRAAKAGIDTNWARAVARQESAYQPYARSHVGARGLMQLMPKTASSTARKHKVPYRRTSDLYKPATNISLGVAYLAEMQKRFKQNQVYATAAYNAGPHRVQRWLKERGDLSTDVWVETIPFSETQKYVKNVMAYHAVYRALAGQPPHILGHQTAFRVAMQKAAWAQQADQLRHYINNHNLTQ